MALFFIFAAVILRLLPHEPNFAPIAAMALFGGVYLDKKYALLLPLVAMFVSDYFLGFANTPVVISVYLSFLIIGLLGFWLREHKKASLIFASTISGSIIFFILTNFAVWFATPWYAKDLSGLLHCFTLALPFFRNTILGDFFYVGLMFGLYELVMYIVTQRKLLPLKVRR